VVFLVQFEHAMDELIGTVTVTAELGHALELGF
jgi:hypothetical protein